MSTFLHLFVGCVFVGVWCMGVVPVHVYTPVHKCLCVETRVDVGYLSQPLSILFLETWSACFWSTLPRAGLWACRLKDSAHLYFPYAGIAGPMALSISLCVRRSELRFPCLGGKHLTNGATSSSFFICDGDCKANQLSLSWWFSGLIFRTRESRT